MTHSIYAILGWLVEPAVDAPGLMRDWQQDARQFLHHDLPKIVFVLVVSFLLIRVLRALTNRMSAVSVPYR